jgi:hypothetical protein
VATRRAHETDQQELKRRMLLAFCGCVGGWC